MNLEKLSRTVTVVCPTCGGTQFAQNGQSPIVTCASCGREISKDALVEENGASISKHVEEIGKEATKEIAEEMRRQLKKAFSGSKFIKIK